MMRKTLVGAAITLLLVAAPAPAPAQTKVATGAAEAQKEKALAIVGGVVHTGVGQPIEDGTVVTDGALIRSVDKGGAAPSNALVIDAKGKVVTAGLCDPLTSVGLVEIDLETTARDDYQGGDDPIRAGFRAADAYNPLSTLVKITRLEGVTSVGVLPVGGLISGQSAWADLDGTRASEALSKSPLAIHVRVQGSYSESGGGRGTSILRIREAFDDARAFAKNRAGWERNQSRPFAPSRLDLEALVTTLGGKVPVVFHVDRAADILTVLSMAKDFSLRPVIAGGAEAWRVADVLAKDKVPVIVLPLIAGPESFDALGARDDNAALLFAKGVRVSLSTGESHNARKLRQVAGNAVRAGMPHEAAIEAITRAPAEALGMDALYGTLEKGKTANLVVWTGDPLELSSRAETVVIRGRVVPLVSRQSALFDKYRTLPKAP